MILVGPLRDAFEAHPLVLFASGLFLFVMPGLLLSHWFFADRFSGAALVPVSFVISAGIFGILGVPVLMAHLTFDAYLWVVGAVLAVSLAAAMVRAFRRPLPDEEGEVSDEISRRWLWAPFLVLGMALAAVSRAKVPHPYNDIWVYLAYVRDFLEADRLALREPYFGSVAELSRAQINGWLLQQAALARISGIDPVVLVLDYLAPTLVFVSLLAFYALARTLFKSQATALFSGSLYALFFLLHLEPSVFTFGGEFISRITEDKFAAKFIFLPVSLAFTFAFVESRRLRYLAAFAFVCWSVITTHPVGMAIIGLCVAGFGIVHVAINWRRREAWATMAALGVALCSVVLAPALYVLGTGNSLTAILSDADINSHDPEVLANMVFVKLWWKHVLELENGYYIMHPSLILDRVILAALMLGLPFLLWRLRSSLAAQLLFGALVLATVVVYVPPIATFVGDNLVLPGQLWRLAWPIPLAALMALGWVAWEATGRAGAWLSRFRPTRPLARVLPLLLVVALTIAAVPRAAAGIDLVQGPVEHARTQGLYPADPISPWFREELRSPAVVLAKDLQSVRIPAYSSETNVVSRRGSLVLRVLPELERRAPGRIEVPQGSLDVQEFFLGATFARKVEILRHHEVDYVMVQVGSRLDRTLGALPGFKRVSEPSERYDVYHVDLRELDQPPPK